MSTRLDVSVWGALAATLLLWGGAAPESPVADAAMRGDAELLRALLEDGADVNAAQGDGMTALHWAAERGDEVLARMLLDGGANVAAVTRLGDYAPLHLAGKAGAEEVIRLLVGAGAELEARTSTGGATPLHFAAASGSVAAVDELLAAGADPDGRERMWGQTPLMFAAAGGRAEAVVALLDGGADPSITARVLDMAERERVDQADRRRQTEIADRIRAAREGRVPAGVGTSGQPPGYGDRPPPAGRGGSVGGGASGAGEAAGASVASRDQVNRDQRDRRPTGRLSHAQLVGGYGGLTALLLAAREGHEHTALTLVERGSDIDQVSGGDGTSPLLMAVVNGHFDLAMELLERGADVSVASHAGATPLYAALNTNWIPKSRHPQPADYMQQEVGYLELMTALLERGADVNARLDRQLWFTTFGDDYLGVDRAGATPFWRAAYALDLDAMRLLLAFGADPDIPTVKTAGRSFGGRDGGSSQDVSDPSGLPPVAVGGPGAYPLHAASGIGFGEGFAANIHRSVPDGWLPAVRFLVEELGADVNARDHNGYNAVHHAAARGDDELIRYLVSKGADVMAVSRSGQTTVDMANGPVQRVSPFPSTIALLESLGAKNNHNCVSC